MGHLDVLVPVDGGDRGLASSDSEAAVAVPPRLLWSLVFPIGMYGASTYRMLAVTGFSGLNVVPEVVLGVSSIAWLLTTVGTVRSLQRAGSRADTRRGSAPERQDNDEEV